MKHIPAFLLVALCTIESLSAQYAEDALRFSRNYFGGTARMTAMGGAQQALGADLSSLVGNPAGLGFYRSNDFSISPTLRFNTAESSAFGTLSSERKDNFNIGSLGVNITQMNRDWGGSNKSTGWVSFSFAFGVNRINNYHEDRFFSGVNNTSGSYSQALAEAANRVDTGSIFDAEIFSIEEMGWQAYAYDYDVANNVFEGLGANGRRQQQTDREEGSQNEWTFAMGANYGNTLYLGASLGIGSVRFDRVTRFTESDIQDTLYNLRSIRLNERLNVDGNSVNLKIGAILRPNDLLRFGFTLQTPDYYSFDERFITDLSSDATGTSYSFTPLEYLFRYDLRTPFKYSGGIALFLQKYAILSADIELLNYAENRLSSGGINSDFGPVQNAEISSLYQDAVNYRLGGELKFGDLSLRAGYANYGDPFQNPTIDNSRQFITAGMGYRYSDYYLDFAFTNLQYQSQYSPYFLDNGTEPVVSTEHRVNSFMVTIGTRF